MAETVYKAKMPFKQEGKYYYPITSYDQIITPDGGRWSGKTSYTAADVGAAAKEHTHSQYFLTSNIIYSTTEPSGSAGMIWLKPAE